MIIPTLPIPDGRRRIARPAVARWVRGHKAIAVLAVLLTGSLAYGISAGVANARWEDHAAGLDVDVDELTSRLDTATTDLDAALVRATTAEGLIDDAESRATAAERAADDRQSQLDERESTLDEREQAVADREAAVTKAEDRQAETRIHEGTWTVGVDVEPGTYRTTEAVTTGTCYWGIYRTGSNTNDIVDNDIVTGGYPSVSLREGQDFTTSDCGTWDKQ